MDRKITQLKRSLIEFADQVMRFSRAYLIPAIQETVYFASQILTFVIEASSEKDHKYRAEFISPDEVLNTSNHGFCIDGRRKLSTKASMMHALIVGSSGSGKTQCCVLPSLLELEGSLIINDPSFELYLSSSGYLKSKGYEIITVNYSKPSVSNGYNPMARIESVSDCNKIAHMLVRNTLKGTGDPFWSLQSVTLMTMLMRALLSEDIQYRNLANVRHLVQMLSADHKLVDKVIAKTGNAQLINEYKSFLSFDDKVRLGIQATCLAALQIFTDPDVAKVTSVDTLNLDKIRSRKTALFIHCHVGDMAVYSPVTSLFFEQLSKVLMSTLPGKTDLPVYYILDEFSSLYMPNTNVIISNIRKYQCGLMLICQDYQQIVDVYGKQQAESIRSNTYGKVYFGGVSHATATELSAQLGKYEYTDEKGRKIRELKKPDEIRTLDKDRAIFICGNYKPILLRMTPVYKHPFLKLRSQIPAPKIKGTLSEGEVALVQ